MAREALEIIIEQGEEIEFNYRRKRFSITYYRRDGHRAISFCEFYKEVTDVETFDELCEVKRYGVKVIDMITSISDDDIDIY